MCQSDAYMFKDGVKELIMEDVCNLKPHQGGIILTGMFGEEKQLNARIKEILLVDHEILLEEN
ncbi:MAG: CooT family nickel-binding protein [Firmicutes bacterium]|nr:CooT family nickel-binding protein [Bacillota bacterium]